MGSTKTIKPLQVFRLAHEGTGFSYHVGNYLIEKFNTEVKQNIDSIINGRDYFRTKCQELGYKAWGVWGNFVLVDFGSKELLNKLVSDLEKRGIYIKYNYSGELSSCASFTAGPEDIMERVIEVLADK